MKPLIISPEAVTDLREIASYIAIDRPERGLALIDELERKAMQIAKNPLSYRERREIASGLRAVRHGSYLIFFRDLPD